MLQLLAALGSAAVLAAPQPVQSWSDALHGWKAAGPGVEATTDGGRHWHVVFRWGPGGAAQVESLLLTSPRAGIANIGWSTFVTSDGGRHWYLVSGGLGAQSFGAGSLLFGVGNGGITQAVQWPLRNLRCRGRWFHQMAGSLSAYGPKPRTICLEGPGINVRMRTVYSLPVRDGTWEIFGHALVPGGVLAGVYNTSVTPYVFEGELVYRNGTGTIHDLPGADSARAFVDWPNVALVGGAVTWTSADGGDTWTSSR